MCKVVMTFLSFVISFSVFAGTKSEIVSDEFIRALIQKESTNNDFAEGDKHLRNHAYGPLQIRLLVCKDLNERLGWNVQPRQFLGNRELSIRACRAYLSIWATERRLGRPVTDEDRARIWNGGPNGHKSQATIGYWKSVYTILMKEIAAL